MKFCGVFNDKASIFNIISYILSQNLLKSINHQGDKAQHPDEDIHP